MTLSNDGVAEFHCGGADFWTQPAEALAAVGSAWLVSEFSFDADWPTWEMHPDADEFVYLLSGEAELLLETASGIERVRLSDRAAVIVPRGVWHTAEVRKPSRMLHLTMGRDTQNRPTLNRVNEPLK
ncbi:MAG: cupin domain-containing protein [Burkholderiaceae bacterium]